MARLWDRGDDVGVNEDPGPRRLRRRAHHRLVAGVAGGLADYSGVRPVFFRIAFVLFTIVGGLGVLVYLLLWWIVPRADLPDSAGQRLLRRFPSAPSWVGIGLLMLATVLLAGEFGLWRPGVVLAFLLIGLGVILFKRDAQRATPTGTRAPVEPASTARIDEPDYPDREPDPDEPAPASERRRRPRSPLGGLTIGAVLLVAAIAAALDNLDVVGLKIGQHIALSLTILAVGLLVGAVWGRARWLILVGTLLLPAVLAASVIRVPLEGGFGALYQQPVSAQEVPAVYRRVAGNMIIDLSRLRLDSRPVSFEASVGVGEISVLVARDARVQIVGDVGAGTLQVLRNAERGFDLTVDRVIGPSTGDVQLVLYLRAGIGSISVYRVAGRHRDEKQERPKKERRPKDRGNG